MKVERPTKRMTLREIMTHAEKCTRDLIEHCQADVAQHMSDYRDLTRPARRSSHYPTLLAVQNALNKLEHSAEEAMVLSDYLLEQMQTILEGVRKEATRRR